MEATHVFGEKDKYYNRKEIKGLFRKIQQLTLALPCLPNFIENGSFLRFLSVLEREKQIENIIFEMFECGKQLDV